VHIENAAGATATALECPLGAYDVVDGNPWSQHLWLTALRVPQEHRRYLAKAALWPSGPDAVYHATRLRGLRTRKLGASLSSVGGPLEWI
jgi:hypothetical protein